MPTLGELLALQQPQNTPPVEAMVATITDSNSMGLINFVDMTGRTPTAGQTGIAIRVGGVFYLIGLR